MTSATRYNVKSLGLQRVKTINLQQEVSLSADGLWALKACFLNQLVPGVKVDDFDYVRTRVTFRDSGGREVASLSKPVWLNHDLTEPVHFGVNGPECLLLAVFGNDMWIAPYITKHPPEDWDEFETPMIDGHALPIGIGALQVEIGIVGEDNIGLEPFTFAVKLLPEGKAQF
jgi:hypothetical protein